jgi:dipeptidyl aminopeptidase/acylaminoacyl peptidase
MRMPLRSIALASSCSLLLAACATPQSGKQESAAKAAASAPANVAPPPLIPRKLLFGNPERAAGEISPDGRWLGYVAPDDGVLNVFVAPREHPDQAKVVTHDRKRGVRSFNFSYDGKHLLYPQDEGGNENFHIYSVDLDSGKQSDLTPFKNARADLAGLTPKHPHDVLINANDRNAKYFDPIRIDLRSGKRERLIKNDIYAGFTTDDDFNLRLASKSLDDGSSEWFKRSGKSWKAYGKVPQADSLSTNPIGFTRDGKTLYLLDSRERDTSALFAVDWASGKRSVVHEDARADVGGILADPKTGVARAVSVDYLRTEWTVLDSAIQKDFDYLKTLGDGDVNVVSQSDDDKYWVVVLTRSDASPKYYLYDRGAGKATFWFDVRPALAQEKLAVMHPVAIPARDGLKLVSYYTLPTDADPSGSGKSSHPLPMVLFVHGGPWGRDGYGYNAYHQWLSNRGYAVLSVNYRASTGFGKAFVNAGDLQWGRKMHDDLLDSVDWAIKQDITTKDSRDHGRQLRRLRDAGRRDDDAGCVRLRRRYRRPVEPVYAAAEHSAVLDGVSCAVLHAHGQPRHRRRPQAAQGAFAADLRRPDCQTAVDRPGQERPARQRQRVRADRQGDAGEKHSGDLRALSGRRRLPPPGEQRRSTP